jgi:hypothetical protein
MDVHTMTDTNRERMGPVVFTKKTIAAGRVAICPGKPRLSPVLDSYPEKCFQDVYMFRLRHSEEM